VAHIAGRFNPINYRFSIPGGSATMYAPGSEAVLWWSPTEDKARGIPTASMLDRCTASKTCPKIFETFGGIEMWNQRYSLGLLGTDAKKDIPLPANVRRYYFPGTTHGGGDGGFSVKQPPTNGCVLADNPNPEQDSMRALFVALTDWVSKNAEPPPSKYPTLAAGQMVPAEKGVLKFPAIPGTPQPFGLVNVALDYDFGPRFIGRDVSGIIDNQPPPIRQVLPTYIPQVDSDGNEPANIGVSSPLHSSPLGTYLGWNVTAGGVTAGQICSLVGGYVPFAPTKAERDKAEDPRPSIEERYGDRQGYVCTVQKAVRQSVKDRYLLEVDAKRLIEQATAATVSGDLAFLPATSTARGKAICATN